MKQHNILYLFYAFVVILLSFLLAACSENSESTEPGKTYEIIFEGYLETTPHLMVLDSNLDDVRKLLPYDTVAMDPTPSPDGSRIAFVVADYTEWTGDIYVVNRDGSNLQQLTFAPQLDDQPAWSPDGQRIVFRSYRTGRLGDIWIMDANGGNPVNLTPDPLPGVLDEQHPSWSPSGARIAFASNASGNVDIWTMAADGSDMKQVTDTVDFDVEPAWSPDGAVIAFRRANGSITDIYLVSANGGIAVPLEITGKQAMPVWAPSNQHILFVHQTTPASRPDLYSIRVDGTDMQPVVTDEVAGGSINPAFILKQ